MAGAPKRRGRRRRAAGRGDGRGRRWRALDRIPRETRGHAIAACREMLLALRSLLDAATHGLEGPPRAAPARRIRIR